MIRLFIFLAFFFLSNPIQAADNAYLSAFQHADKGNWGDAQYAARKTSNRGLQDYIEWRRLKDVSERPSAEQLLSFLEQHPSWPDREALLARAEEALMLEGLSAANATRWFALRGKQTDPTPGTDPAAAIINHAWLYGDFNAAEQQVLRSSYRITPEMIRQRVDNLIWTDMINRARDLIPALPPAQQKLAYARIALQTNQKGIDGIVNAIPASLQNDPGLIYDRMRWRARKKLDSGVREMLRAAPAHVPWPQKWWKYRAYQVRELIQAGNEAQALQLASNHAQEDGAELADALWLKGWLETKHAQDPKRAYESFYALYHHVGYPISLSRGAYWAGMAAKKTGNADIAANWFREAAKHPTTFYGQLALAELQPGQPLALTAATDNGSEGNFPADQLALLSLIELLARHNQKASVEKFVQHLASIQNNPQNHYALARFCLKINYPQLRVRVSKIASQQLHVWLGTTSHPVLTMDALAVEPALALAISRQESEFNPEARSSANALGMMQLLPGTAKHTAQRNGMVYDYNKLFNAKYNMQLGSFYLASLIDKFDGSYPLAIAAYNAGPGNVSRWLVRYGPFPKQDVVAQLHWLENIPFAETRNYVQRVLENLHVYRSLLGEKRPLTSASVLGAGTH